jgi:hypothetical protein
MKKSSILMLLAAGISAFFGVETLSQVIWKGTILQEGNVTVVKNPKEPIYHTPILKLEEELSIGGASVESEAGFEQIWTYVVDGAGTFYILDLRASDVKVFDVSGKYLRTIGRKGQGPGELENAMTLSLNRRTGRLAIGQQSRGIAFFKTDGTFLRQLPLKGTMGGRVRLDSQDQIYILDVVINEKRSMYAMRKLSSEASVLATLSETPGPTEPGNKTRAFIPIPYFLIDQDDRFVYGFPETYEIQIYGPADTRAERKITKSYDAVAVTEEERAERKKDVPPNYTREIVFPKHHPAFSRFFVSDLGHLFVQTYEKAVDGKVLHDVFDSEGRLIGRVPLKPSGIAVLKGKYYALEEDEDGYRIIKRYALTWLVK